MSRPSIFEFAGGEPALLALATAHHQRCLDDPVLNHPFSHPGNPEHIQRLADYWAEVLGGPKRYSESFGGHSAMLGIHAGLPDDPDFRAALRAYMEWAVGEVLSISPPGEQAPADLPAPRWGWNGLE